MWAADGEAREAKEAKNKTGPTKIAMKIRIKIKT